jgi:PAS domain S-box-containing protein
MAYHPISILLVEDNVGDRLLVKEYLIAARLTASQIYEAATLAEAIRLIKEASPEIILLDLSLPDSYGIQSFTQIYALTNAPIVVLSGMSDETVAFETVRLGAQDYLLKGEFDEKLLTKSITYSIERKKNLYRLVESEEKYKFLFDNNPIPMWAFDVHSFEFLMVNQAAIQHYGYSREEFLSMTILDIAPPEDVERAKMGIQASLGRPSLNESGEWIHCRKDGSRIEVEAISHTIEIDGRTAWLVVVYDVTERNKAREQLRLREQMFRSMAENFPNGSVGFLDQDLRFVYADGQDFKLHNIEPTEVIGRKYGELQSPEVEAYAEQHLLNALAGNEVVFDISYGNQDYQVSAVPVANEQGVIDKLLLATQNITERKRVEEHLRLLESVITHSNDSVLITEATPINYPGPRIIYVNEAFTKMTGYHMAEVVGKTPRILHGSRTSRHELNRIKSALENHEPVEAELINYTKSRKEFWVHLSIVPVTDAKGHYTHWVSVQRDITQRKKVEEEQQVLIDELMRQNKDLQQFSYITSHNLRAPVANMMGILNLYNRENPADPLNQLLIEKFGESTEQLNSTLSDLIRILVIKNTVNVDSEYMELELLLKKVHKSIENTLEEAHANVSYNFAKAPGLHYNRAHLESIFLNFLTNSARYRSPDRPLEINISSQNSNGYLQINFSDNGLGIDLNRYGERLFGLYQCFHPHAESKGLGLYIVKSQVTALGGKIEVESEVNRGTTFKVFLKNK